MGENASVSKTIIWMSMRILINLVFIFMLAEGFTAAYHFSYKLFADIPFAPTSTKRVEIVIHEGESVWELSKDLDEKGVVEGKYMIFARIYLEKYNNEIKAGKYVLGPSMTPVEICRTVCGLQQGEES